jgi:protein gp37
MDRRNMEPRQRLHEDQRWVCKHCYAETFAERFRGVKGHPYEQGFDLRLVPEKLTEPLRWRSPRMVFVNSMSDLFHEYIPDSYVASVTRVMVAAN